VAPLSMGTFRKVSNPRAVRVFTAPIPLPPRLFQVQNLSKVVFQNITQVS
jgi:hypothetical protein